MFKKETRKATYTMSVPLQFTFCGENNWDCNEIFENAKKELYKRLANGYFDVLVEKLDVEKKLTHRTKEEIKKEKEDWENFLKGLVRKNGTNI